MTDQTTDPFVQKTEQVSDPFADQLNSITNDGGKPKYESVEKALEALKHSQEYIPQLKTELSSKDEELERLRKELNERKGIEEMLETWQSTNDKTIEGKPADQQAAPSVDVKSVEQLVRNILNSDAESKVQNDNFISVQNSLVEKYGDKAGEVVRAKAQELNTTPEALKTLSKTSPQLVLSLFDAKQQPKQSVSTSSVTIPPINKNNSNEIQRPEKSLLKGATLREQREFIKQIRNNVHEKYEVQS